jgi:hypothetical protein
VWEGGVRGLAPWVPSAAAILAGLLAWPLQMRQVQRRYHRAESNLGVLDDVETELAFLVPDRATLDRFAALRHAGVCVLRPAAAPVLDMRDHYFDTPDAMLARHGAGLRIRTIARRAEPGVAEEGATLVTLKLPGGGGVRTEIERPWSTRHLRQVVQRLTELGIALPSVALEEPGAAADDAGDPDATLARLGLHAVQRRSTQRRVRDVILVGPDPHTIAELALDSVRYTFDGTAVVLHEIEVEVRGWASVATARAIGDRLRDAASGAMLRPWPWSKLHTGRVIEQLIRDRVLAAGPDGELGPAALDLLERALATAAAPGRALDPPDPSPARSERQ